MGVPASYLIIANATSGRGRGQRTAKAVAGTLRTCGNDVEIKWTTSAGDGRRLAMQACERDADRPTCVVACGGDGTIQQVAGVLAEQRARIGDDCPSMGLAPAGRCNDFARALGVPRDPQGIADVLVSGTETPVDLGRANGRYFCTVATLGVDAEVSRFVDAMRIPLRGTLAYVYGALRVLARYRPTLVRIEGAFGVIEKAVFLASTANTASYGGAIEIAPDAVATDGLLDLCVIDHVSRVRAFVMLPRVLLGWHRSHPGVAFYRSSRLRIESDEPLELWADGERLGQTPVTIEAVKEAVRILLPAKPEAGDHTGYDRRGSEGTA